ncbi:hypothetical protein V491_02132, partial [Pseudogymnoascus sp. VKM F-3775]
AVYRRLDRGESPIPARAGEATREGANGANAEEGGRAERAESRAAREEDTEKEVGGGGWGSLVMWSGNGPHARPAGEIRGAHKPNTRTGVGGGGWGEACRDGAIEPAGDGRKADEAANTAG